MFRKIALSFLIVAVSKISHAQIDHYWSQTFNTASTLLAGAVVGGDSEVAAIFYNPAHISKLEQNNFALTASLFKYESFQLENALGNGLDISRDFLKIVPKFLSYTLQKNEKLDFEFAIFTRNQNKVSFFNDFSTTTNILSQPDGDEYYNGELQYKQDYSDKWISFGFSNHVSNNLSLGLGTYFPIKNISNEYELNVSAFPQTDSVQIGRHRAVAAGPGVLDSDAARR